MQKRSDKNGKGRDDGKGVLKSGTTRRPVLKVGASTAPRALAKSSKELVGKGTASKPAFSKTALPKTAAKAAPARVATAGARDSSPGVSIRKAPAKGGKSKAAKVVTPRNEKARKLAMFLAEAGLEKKAINVEVIDVLGRVDYCDYVVVMAGTSDRHVSALARHLEEDAARKKKAKCAGVEGKAEGTWVLLDYVDVIVHIFHQETRGYYDLDALWLDAARIPVKDGPPGARESQYD